jgi:hypothetical protein
MSKKRMPAGESRQENQHNLEWLLQAVVAG